VTGAEHGVSIAYPQGWRLDANAGMGLGEQLYLMHGLMRGRYPRAVLSLSPTGNAEPGCPLDGHDPAFLDVERLPLTLNGPASRSWPVSLVPVPASVAVSYDAPSCVAGWRYWSATWTSGGRTFRATGAAGPSATTRDVDALMRSFASMHFERVATRPEPIVTLLSGVRDSRPWYLVAMRDRPGFELSLSLGGGESSGVGGRPQHGRELAAVDGYLGEPGTDRPGAYFGYVPVGTTELVARGRTIGNLRPTILDVPDEISRTYDAFFMETPRGAVGTLLALDAGGNVLGRVSVGGYP
jgi:hypothetical protein